MQETRRWQWYSEGSWEFTGDLRLSGELLLAETEVPHWGTSPSYPPSEVIDLARINDRLSIDAAIFNLTDREPPGVYRQLNYDPLTHNPLGRLVEVGLR